MKQQKMVPGVKSVCRPNYVHADEQVTLAHHSLPLTSLNESAGNTSTHNWSGLVDIVALQRQQTQYKVSAQVTIKPKVKPSTYVRSSRSPYNAHAINNNKK